MAIPVSKSIVPAVRKPIMIPVVAVLDWIMAVMTMPAKTAYRWLSSNARSRRLICSTFFSVPAKYSNPLMAANTQEIPNKTNPILRGLFFLNRTRMLPAIANGIRYASILKVINSVVKVVPIFVPSIIPIDCGKVSSLAETNPIVMIITAELLCKTAVIKVPMITPFQGAFVNLTSHLFNESAERFMRPDLNNVIPYMNKPIKSIKNNSLTKLPPPRYISMAEGGRTCQLSKFS